jgi:micrococcal nuclease
MSRVYCAGVVLFALILFISPRSFCEEPSPSAASADYGQADVETVLRVNSQCWIFCDIQDWPAIIGKEIPVQIRGLDPQQSFDLPVRQFILETLSAALKQNPAPAEPNQSAGPKVLLKRLQRASAFCLIADVEVNGRDLAQLLVDKGYAKKWIIPKTAAGTSVNSPAVQPSTANGNANVPTSATEGFVASKSGKVFHKSTCPHAKRIADNTRVLYQTREEAAAAGRRPCQTCNP